MHFASSAKVRQEARGAAWAQRARSSLHPGANGGEEVTIEPNLSVKGEHFNVAAKLVWK